MKRKLLALLVSLPMLTACMSEEERRFSEYRDGIRKTAEARKKAAYDALSPEEKIKVEAMKKKFHGIYGLVLRIDADVKRGCVTIRNEFDRIIVNTPAGFGPKQVGNLTYTDYMPVPLVVHATWITGECVYDTHGVINGTLEGGYTAAVAERIPDSVLDYIRKNGGALRLKIRLVDDGILIAWDVEKSLPIPNCVRGRDGAICTELHYFLPGGDFKEIRRSTDYTAYGLPESIPYPPSNEHRAILEKQGLELWYSGDVWAKGWYIDKKTGKKIYVDY